MREKGSQGVMEREKERDREGEGEGGPSYVSHVTSSVREVTH